MYEPLVNPPLVEAVCEFRFDPSEEWDWTVPGRLYDRIEDEFPRRDQVQGLEFTVQVGGDPVPAVQGGLERVRMSREDGSALVQVGQNQLAINHRLPYPGWETFFDLINRVLALYLEIVPSSPQRTGLRYINQIPGLFEGVEIGSLTTFDPPIPTDIERPLLNFYQRYELLHDQPRGVLIHQTGIQPAPEEETVLVLDIDFGSLQGSAPDVNEAGPWLRAAHDRVEEAFRASVNPELLNKMREGNR